MRLKPFVLHRPSTVGEASYLLEQAGPDGMALAGGTELLLAMRSGLLSPKILVDIKRIPFRAVEVDRSGELRLGARVTHREIELSPEVAARWPMLREMEQQLGNVRVRNQGTLAGNLCFNEPHGDPAAVLVAQGARVTIAGPNSERSLPVSNFLAGPFATDVQPGEVLTEIRVPPLPERSASAYRRFATSERPLVGVAVVLAMDSDGVVSEATAVVGAVGPRPQSLGAIEEMIGTAIGAGGFDAAADEAIESSLPSCEVRTDHQASDEYKRALIRVLARRAIGACRERLRASLEGASA